MTRKRRRHRARSSKLVNRLGRQLAAERLEDRQLLDASSMFDGGVVVIEANDDDNNIRAYVHGDVLTVEVDDIHFDFTNHLVDHIKVYAKGGNDSIVIENSVGQTTTLDGGRGNDKIQGSRQNDAIYGGAGNDAIRGMSGNDFIQGGWGNDNLNGGYGNDTIVGDPADIHPVPVPMPVDADLVAYEDVMVEAVDVELIRCIGRDTLVADRVAIPSGAMQHGLGSLDLPVRQQPGVFATIQIGQDCWIGAGAIILADVGDHCVVAAGSVVTRPVEDWTIVAGVPARVVGDRREKAGQLSGSAGARESHQ